VEFALFVSNRHVFARQKGVTTKAISGLVVISSAEIVIEYPPRVLGTSGLVNETPDQFVIAVPKSADAAMLAKLLPQ
jgi:hypothetical protein